MPDEVELSVEELALLATFRQQQAEGVENPEEAAIRSAFRTQMADPNAPPTVSVVNESLGKLMDGTKIQFIGNKPGWTPEPAPKGYARWKAREDRRLEAQAAAKSRSRKSHKSVYIRVKDAMEKLDGRNVMDTLALIEQQSPAEREVFVLAEELSESRKGVLQQPGNTVSRKLRDAYALEKQTLEEAASVDAVEPLLPASNESA